MHLERTLAIYRHGDQKYISCKKLTNVELEMKKKKG